MLPAFLMGFLALPTAASALVINEFLPSPQTGSNEWVEFYNEQDSAEYIKAYYLDDDLDFVSDTGSTGKRSLANLNMDNVHYPYFEMMNILNNGGDWVVLFDSAGNIIDQYQYTSNPGTGISIGRSPDQVGSFSVSTSVTKGSPNPSATPTTTPTPEPTMEPTPTLEPTATEEPTPTTEPTVVPTVIPTAAPTDEPSPQPTLTNTPTSTTTPLPTTVPYHFQPWKCHLTYLNKKIMWMNLRFPRLLCEKI